MAYTVAFVIVIIAFFILTLPVKYWYIQDKWLILAHDERQLINQVFVVSSNEKPIAVPMEDENLIYFVDNSKNDKRLLNCVIPDDFKFIIAKQTLFGYDIK